MPAADMGAWLVHGVDGDGRRPSRVLWLTKGLGRGGTERLLASTISYLDPTRVVVEVAYLLPWKDSFVSEIESHGVPVHCLGRGANGSAAWVLRFRRLLRDRGFDIVHTHMPLPASVARVTGGRRTPVFVHTEHNLWDRYRTATRVANVLTYPRNRAVIAVSQGVASSIRPPRCLMGGWPEVEVIVHGPARHLVKEGPEARIAARRLLGLSPEVPVVGTVGNFTAKKDQRRLLLAVRDLQRRALPSLHLVLVGSGPLQGELVELTAELRLSERVLFAGSRDDVFDLLPGFDVFALSSTFEGLPISLLEAMATGVPCVATGVGGIPEVLTDGVDGFLVQPGDHLALARAIERLLLQPQLRSRIGAAGQRRSVDFDLRAAARSTQDLYDRVLRG